MLTEQSFLSEKSLWYRKRLGKREKSDPVSVEEISLTDEAKADLATLLQTRFGKAAVRAFMYERFGDEDICYSKDMKLDDDFAYVMSLIAAMESNDDRSFYRIEQLEGSYSEGPYTMPQLRFVLKEEK